jgi:type II secretory pathway pseudopilin PulG
MLTGKNASGREVLAYRRVSRTEAQSFTLIETLVVAGIIGIIFSALFSVLNLSNLSHSIVSTKLSLQAEARRVIEWIVKDARQTSAYQISNNNATSSYIKFKTCAGHNGTSLLWNSDFIEYDYNSSSQILTRTDYSTGDTWDFYDIVANPFDVSGLANNILGVTIDVQKDVIGTVEPRVNLTTEIKIRNG